MLIYTLALPISFLLQTILLIDECVVGFSMWPSKDQNSNVMNIGYHKVQVSKYGALNSSDVDFNQDKRKTETAVLVRNKAKIFLTTVTKFAPEIRRYFAIRTTPMQKHKRGKATALFAANFCVMGGKCALPCTLSLLISRGSGLDSGGGNVHEKIAKVIGLSTFSIALGKLLLGPIIDKVGGVICLKVALLILSILMGTIASTSSFQVFSVSLFLIDFIFSSAWAASLNIIQSTFSENEWPGCISLLAIASRTGNAISFLIFASLISHAQSPFSRMNIKGQPWRIVFLFGAAMQILPLALLSFFDQKECINDTGDKSLGIIEQESITNNPPLKKTSLTVLRQEIRKPQFWLYLTSRSCLMVIASFLLFVPSYMSNCFGMSSAAAARVGSVYAVGSMVSISMGAKLFSSLSSAGKISLVIGMMGSLILCSLLHMGHISGVFQLSSTAGALSMFFWGLAFSIPFYIPPSLYALKHGGKESSATIADSFDVVGFLLLAFFNKYVTSLPQEVVTSWLRPFEILLSSSVVSLVTLGTALRLDREVVNT